MYFSAEHRRKLGEANKKRRGKNHPFWGKKMNFKNPELRNKNISLGKIGKPHKGTPHTVETKKKLSLAHIGKKQSPESVRKTIEKISGEKAYQWKGGQIRYWAKNAPRKKPDQCEICGIFGYELKKGLCYDHNHETGKFRGWLCGRCNLALGFVKDNTETLLKMVQYLQSDGLSPPL